MSCYFINNVYFKKNKPQNYEEYIKKVIPIVEKYGGKYLIRSEDVFSFDMDYIPSRVIIIEFQNKKDIFKCFNSKEYKKIMNLRKESVKSRAIIVGGRDEK